MNFFLTKKTKDRLTMAGGIVASIFASTASVTYAIDGKFITPLIRIMAHAQIGIAGIGIVAAAVGFLAPEKATTWLDFRRRTLSVAEIDGLHAKLTLYAGGHIVAIGEKIKIYQANSDGFSAVEIVSTDGLERRTVGYIMLYFLNKATTERIASGRIHGAHVSASNIVRPKGKASSVYIGFVWGNDRKSKAAVLKHAAQMIESARKSSDFKIFTRPTTPEALQVAKRRGFKSVKDDQIPTLGAVCYL